MSRMKDLYEKEVVPKLVETFKYKNVMEVPKFSKVVLNMGLIAAFKLREGMPIGCMVTLRHARMFDFLQKLVNVALPRVRDFRGVSAKAFDGRGNYSLGIKEHIIFPEIDYDKIDAIKGLNISIVTTARTDEEGKELLRLMGMPFRN
jgi:large subunit ribosomal protein L5